MGEGFNVATYLVGRHLEAGDGERVAVKGSATLTYAELDVLTGNVAASYRRLELRRDDRIVLVMADDVEMFVAILGAFRAGLVAVPVSTMLTGGELAKVTSDSGARVVVATSEFVDAVGPAISESPEVEVVVLAGGGAVSFEGTASQLTWDDFLILGKDASEAETAVADTSEDSWALWLYTSGTTGAPKAAMHRHANIRAVCETYGTQVLGITPDDKCFSIAKLFFAYGIGNSLFFPLSVGACAILEPRRPTPEVIRERLAADQPTLFFGVPAIYASLLGSDIPDESFNSVRLATSAGEALPAPLLQRFGQRFDVEIIDGIGSTEALHIFLSNRPGEVRPGTTGRAVPGYKIELRDESGAPVAPGTAGALHVRGESIALGYWRRAEATRQAFQGEWLQTGDTYIETEDGFFTCLGRNNDMLKAGGIWVSPAEVESRLLEHADVFEAAVVGIKDKDDLIKPIAFVVVRGEITEADLVAWCREGLAAFKRPRQVIFVDEIPKTATGKLQRFKLRDMFDATASAPVETVATPTSTGAP